MPLGSINSKNIQKPGCSTAETMKICFKIHTDVRKVYSLFKLVKIVLFVQLKNVKGAPAFTLMHEMPLLVFAPVNSMVYVDILYKPASAFADVMFCL